MPAPAATRGQVRGACALLEFSWRLADAMGLSQDPEKRERQMANLRKGWAKHAERLQDPKPEPTPETKPRAAKPALEVMDYEQPQPKPAKPKQKRRQQPARSRQPARQPEPEPEPRPEPRGGGGGRSGGFWDGFLGR